MVTFAVKGGHAGGFEQRFQLPRRLRPPPSGRHPVLAPTATRADPVAVEARRVRLGEVAAAGHAAARAGVAVDGGHGGQPETPALLVLDGRHGHRRQRPAEGRHPGRPRCRRPDLESQLGAVSAAVAGDVLSVPGRQTLVLTPEVAPLGWAVVPP